MLKGVYILYMSCHDVRKKFREHERRLKGCSRRSKVIPTVLTHLLAFIDFKLDFYLKDVHN